MSAKLEAISVIMMQLVRTMLDLIRVNVITVTKVRQKNLTLRCVKIVRPREV